MYLSIIIPAKNEAEGISYVVRGVRKVVGANGEIIIIDENSNDGTIEKARLADENIRVFQRDGNGKGMGIRKAVEVFKGDVFLTIDSDATYDPQDIQIVIDQIIANRADVVLGSRFMGKMAEGSMNRLHYLSNSDN